MSMTEREINDKIVGYQKKIKESAETVRSLKEQKDFQYRSVQDMSGADYYKTKSTITLMTSIQNEIDAEVQASAGYERQIEKLIGLPETDDRRSSILKWKTA